MAKMINTNIFVEIFVLFKDCNLTWFELDSELKQKKTD